MQEKEAEGYREYPICRTCLNVIRSKSYRLQENSGCGEGLKISHVLRYIVPELYLGLSSSPEICGNCRESLRVAYTFRKLCLETETMIGNYLKNVRCTAQIIDLGAVIGYLSNRKTEQAAQKIISEWEDDTEEPPTVVEQMSKKIPISNLETLKNAVASVKQLSEKPSSSTTTSFHHFVQVIDESEQKEATEQETNEKDSEIILSNDSVEETDFLEVDNRIHKDKSGNNTKGSVDKDPLTDDQIIQDSSLIFCEETGLLKNHNGEYFNSDGTTINKEQVENEKSVAKIRAENLFQITNICTVTDDDFNKSGPEIVERTPKASSSQSNLDQKDSDENLSLVDKIVEKNSVMSTVKKLRTVRKELHVRDISEMMGPPKDSQSAQPINPLTGSRKTYSKSSENKHIQKTYKRSRLTNFDENNLATSTQPKSQTGKSNASFMEESTEKPITNILNFSMNKNLGIPEMNPTSNKNISHKITIKSFAKENQTKFKNILDYLPKADLPHTPTFDTLNVPETVDPLDIIPIKEEPQDHDDEDQNLTANDSEDTLSVSDNSPWDKIINSLDDCGNNYVDIPDFVQINNVIVKDFEDLKEQTQNSALRNNTLEWLNKMKINKPEGKTQPDAEKKDPQQSWKKLPDRYLHNGKMLVKCGNYYKIDESYVDPATRPVFRRTIKLSKQRKLKIVPVNTKEATPLPKNQGTSKDNPDRQVCVLFTNYTDEGVYINDHDYLLAPYVRNKVLIYEGREIFCVCFICGSKHWLDKHVEHMKSHSSKCPACKVNLGTSYMLNLHMKSHTITCKKCGSAVPYAEIKQHSLKHQKEDGDNPSTTDDLKQEETAPFSKLIKRCMVPMCTNTTRNSSKIFISVPMKYLRKWSKAVGRLRLPKQKCVYCCEDHFDMENDCMNWQEYKLMYSRIRMKDVVPHKHVSTPSTVPRRFSQLDEESRKLREKNMRYLMENKFSEHMTTSESYSDTSSVFDESMLPRSRKRQKQKNEKETETAPEHPSNISNGSQINIEGKTGTDNNDSEDKTAKQLSADLSSETNDLEDCDSHAKTDATDNVSSRKKHESKSESESDKLTDLHSSRETEDSCEESEKIKRRGKKRRILDEDDEEEKKVVEKRVLRSRVKKPIRKKRATR